MTRPARSALLLMAACLAGWGAGELLIRSLWCRAALAGFAGRGELRAIVAGRGIYQADVDAQPEQDLEALVVNGNVRFAARHTAVSEVEIEGEMNLLRAQFGTEEIFRKALLSSMLTMASLRDLLVDHLRARAWIEEQIAPALRVTDGECRQFYESHRAQFSQPKRLRVSHLFLAVHSRTPDEIIAAKREAIRALGLRIAKGESLAQLAALSEDEATKGRGGDLGFLSALRTLPEFFAQVENLPPGRMTPPFQSHLGFHIAQVTETKLAEEMSFEEVRLEVADALRNEKRASAVAAQNGVAEFRQPSL